MNHFSKQTFLRWQKPLNQLNCRLINFENKNKVLAMNEVYFKHLQEEQKIAISFRFVQNVEAKKIDRIFNFVRDLSENLDVGLNRIKTNLEKEFTKKTKKIKIKKNQAPTEATEENPENVQVRLRKFTICLQKNFRFLAFRSQLSYETLPASSPTKASLIFFRISKPVTFIFIFIKFRLPSNSIGHGSIHWLFQQRFSPGSTFIHRNVRLNTRIAMHQNSFGTAERFRRATEKTTSRGKRSDEASVSWCDTKILATS